ncbi:hypothetical protein FRC01_008878, partial [Tulasnella sp. 417]
FRSSSYFDTLTSYASAAGSFGRAGGLDVAAATAIANNGREPSQRFRPCRPTPLRFILRYDDCLEIFAAHAIGRLVGNICTDFFAQSSVAAFDGIAVIPGGWLDHNRVQLGYQLADSTAGISYSFVMTTIILWIMYLISGCRLRTDEESEIIGIDDAEMGEFASDYVAVGAELGRKADWLVLPIMALQDSDPIPRIRNA